MIKKGGLGEENKNEPLEENKNASVGENENEPLEEEENASIGEENNESVEEEENASVGEEKNESVKEKKNEPVDVTGVLEQDAEDKNESVEEEKKNEPVPDIVEQPDAVAPEIQSGVINKSNKLSETLLKNKKISALVEKNPNIGNAISLLQDFLPETAAAKINIFLEKNPDFIEGMNLDAMISAANDNDRVDAFVTAYNSITYNDKPVIDEVSIENAKKNSTGETGFQESFVTTLECTLNKSDNMVFCKEKKNATSGGKKKSKKISKKSRVSRRK